MTSTAHQVNSTGPATTPAVAHPAAPTPNPLTVSSKSSTAPAPSSAAPSYASATKGGLPPNASGPSNMSTTAGGNPPANSISPINGRNPTIPAVPSVGGPTIVNGNNVDHSRKPSFTVTSAGTTGFASNGGAVGGVQNKPNSIQFGSMNAGGSPALNSTPPALANQTSSTLGVGSLNPRVTSPQTSPSPIPQPAASGGRPPSGLQGQGNGLSFGQLGGESNDPNRPMRAMPPGQLGHAPQPIHLRRDSSQSSHGEMGNQGMPSGPGRGGYPMAGGRGRGYTGQYAPQMAYPPSQNFRPPPNGRGMQNMQPGFHPGRQQGPFPGSPNLAARSPAMMNANPVTPQMGQVQMIPGMPGQHNGFPPYMGGPQGHVQFMADPSIQAMYQQQQWFQQQQMPGYMPPQSPRPPYAQGPSAPYMQQTYSGQGQPPHQSQPLSRTGSQMSVTDRPNSSLGQPQTPSLVSGPGPANRTTSSPAPKTNNFTLPPKKSAAIVIKSPQGDVVNFSRPPPAAAQAAPTPAKAAPPPAPTPGSQPSAPVDPSHARTDSISIKLKEEKKKEMQEAVAKKLAEEAKAKQDQEEAEKKALKEKEEAEAQEAKAAETAKAEEEASSEASDTQEEKVAEEPPKPAEEPAKPTPEPAVAPEKAQDDEIDFDAIERELAAKEAEEEAREEEYRKKKEAAKEAQKQKEREEEAAFEANMKKLEREAEEREEELAKKKVEGGSDSEDSKKLFASLKAQDAPTPPASDSPPVQTPAESGTATPISDISVGPPVKGKKDRKPAELTLNTTKAVESPQPSAALKSLQSARFLEDPTKIDYPSAIASPNPALNSNAPADRKFKYNKEFLLQFQTVFKEKPSIDWDTRVRETLGDGGDSSSARPSSARTPSGMGGRSVSNRPSVVPSYGQMGTFGAPPRAGPAQLPPGTTSAQRFAMSNAPATTQRSPMQNPFEAFGRPAGAPLTGPAMSRSASSNVMGGMPQSTRVGGSTRGGTRTGSKRDKQSSKRHDEEDKTMPLTAGMELKAITVSQTGWKPRSIAGPALAGPALGGDGLMAPDVVQRKVKSNLNKMTPEKFDKISDQILEIAAQSKDESDGRTLRQVIQLTFEKATDEAHWASMYAMFCKRMLESMSPDIKDENIKDKHGNVVTGGNLFRKYLLNRCQEEFERGWKVNLPPKPEGQTEEAAMLSDEYYIAAAAKRRGLGLVKFIGELYKLGMLTERIMHECVKKLLDYEGMPDEAEVESLTSLLKTVGANLDNPESKAQPAMNIYFARMQDIMNMAELPSRLKFMILDVIDLRKKGWHSKEDNKGPKTIQQIREEAQRQAQEAEMQRLASQARGSGGRMPMGRGDARGFGYNQMPPPDHNSNRIATDDLRRLPTRASRNPSHAGGPTAFGPTSLLSGRTNSGRRNLGPGGSMLAQREDSGNSSRTGTPPVQKEKEKKDESNTNTFSALAALDGESSFATSPPSTASSPPTTKSRPTIEQERAESPDKSKE